MYAQLDYDDYLLRELIVALRDEYERLDSVIAGLRKEDNFSEVVQAVKEFTSGVRYVYDSGIMRSTNMLSEACLIGDRAKIYSAWVSLHERLHPVLSLMRAYLINGNSVFLNPLSQ